MKEVTRDEFWGRRGHLTPLVKAKVLSLINPLFTHQQQIHPRQNDTWPAFDQDIVYTKSRCGSLQGSEAQKEGVLGLILIERGALDQDLAVDKGGVLLLMGINHHFEVMDIVHGHGI